MDHETRVGLAIIKYRQKANAFEAARYERDLAKREMDEAERELKAERQTEGKIR